MKRSQSTVFMMLKLTACFIFLLLVPGKSVAWGALGHQITGGVAERHLTMKAKNEITKLMGSTSLALAGTWADSLKSDNKYRYLDSWHYVNIPAGLQKTEVVRFLSKHQDPNLFNRLQFIIAKLKNRQTAKAQRVFYLKLLVHFVADVHQPMHVGRLEDRGGNNFRIYWLNRNSNLHRLWDGQLISYRKRSWPQYVHAIDQVSKKQKLQWQAQSPEQWFVESYQLAETLYSELHQNQRLGSDYSKRHAATLDRQLLRGGVRLAGLLNSIFGT